MKQRTSKIIVGSALGIAAIAVTIDHTRHRIPEPVTLEQAGSDVIILEEGETPCGLRTPAPCSLGEPAPCGLGVAPCALGESSNNYD